MKRFLPALLLTCIIALSPSTSDAAGALAIGEPKNLADGFASGWSVNQPNDDTAQSRAFDQCRNKADADEPVRALCKVIRIFSNQCVTIALDTQPGATGTGYAVAPTKAEAERIAMADCRKTAGNRGDQCRIINGGCDGKAK
jgi:hypothetical protein